jgi:hypothetical protein
MTLPAEIAAIVVAAVAVAVCLAMIPRSERRRIARASPPQPSPPERLVRLEQLIDASRMSASHAHAYLRPLLADVVASRLAARGQVLGRMSEEDSRRLLGEELWELVRPDRPFPEDRRSAGVSAEQLTTMLDVLERL